MQHSGFYLENKEGLFAHFQQDRNILFFDDVSFGKTNTFELVLNNLSMVMSQHHTNRIFNFYLLHHLS